jgi:hypothetical protein
MSSRQTIDSSSGVRVTEKSRPESAQLGIFSLAFNLQMANKSPKMTSGRPDVSIKSHLLPLGVLVRNMNYRFGCDRRALLIAIGAVSVALQLLG